MRNAPQNVLALLFAVGWFTAAAAAGDEVPWIESPWFAERVATFDAAPDMRVHVNEPTGGDPDRPTRLLVFATPNGNTLEQTLGCAPGGDRHWRYVIQHIAAQARWLREQTPDERLVLLVTQAERLSWPAWRRDHEGANERIVRAVAEWRDRFAGPDARVTLAAHSGGGSFLWGAIEGQPAIPEWVDRIALLDANYSFDAELHGEKFRRWIEAGGHQLVVVAYDDREITLDGKKVVGPTGGTFRATGRMLAALAPGAEPLSAPDALLTHTEGFGGRFRCEVHTNPANKILHTRLVGDMNGLIHAQLVGHAPADWPGLTTPTVYDALIQPEPYAAQPEAAHPGATQPEAGG